MWPEAIFAYWNKRMDLHKKRFYSPKKYFTSPRWPPFPTWPPWRQVNTLYMYIFLNFSVHFSFVVVVFVIVVVVVVMVQVAVTLSTSLSSRELELEVPLPPRHRRPPFLRLPHLVLCRLQLRLIVVRILPLRECPCFSSFPAKTPRDTCSRPTLPKMRNKKAGKVSHCSLTTLVNSIPPLLLRAATLHNKIIVHEAIRRTTRQFECGSWTTTF